MNETLTIVNNQTKKNNFTKQIIIFSYKLLPQSQQITTKIINIFNNCKITCFFFTDKVNLGRNGMISLKSEIYSNHSSPFNNEKKHPFKSRASHNDRYR